MKRNHTTQMIDIATAWAGRDLAITSLRLRTPDGRTWEIDPVRTGGFRLFEIDLDFREGPTEQHTGVGRHWTAGDLLIYLDAVGQRKAASEPST